MRSSSQYNMGPKDAFWFQKGAWIDNHWTPSMTSEADTWMFAGWASTLYRSARRDLKICSLLIQFTSKITCSCFTSPHSQTQERLFCFNDLLLWLSKWGVLTCSNHWRTSLFQRWLSQDSGSANTRPFRSGYPYSLQVVWSSCIAQTPYAVRKGRTVTCIQQQRICFSSSH